MWVVWRLFCCLFVLYDLGPVVKPRDDIENKNTARVGGGVFVCLLFLFFF